MPELQDLLDEWLIAVWQNRPHDGLRDPLHPGRAFTPNEKYAALIETAGYVPVAAVGPRTTSSCCPPTWRAVNAYGIKISRRTYDGEELNPLRLQHSGVKRRKGLWEVHYDPYDSLPGLGPRTTGRRLDHLLLEVPGTVPAPFGELAWDHVRVGAGRARAAAAPPSWNAPRPSMTCCDTLVDGPGQPGQRNRKASRKARVAARARQPPSPHGHDPRAALRGA